MSIVKRVEAQGVLRELKDFAFEGNHDFQNGRIMTVESQKAFYYPMQEIVDDDTGEVSIPYQKTIVGFSAHRSPDKIRNHNPYVYSLFATSERSIEVIPDHIWKKISIEDEDNTDDEADEHDANAYNESTTVTFGTSDYESGEIQVNHSYDISVGDATIYDHDDTNIFYDISGIFVPTPTIESYNNTDKLFVQEPVGHARERLPAMDNILNEITFRAIIDPFSNDEYDMVIDFRDAANRMRVIMEIMRKGMNVQQLYDLQ